MFFSGNAFGYFFGSFRHRYDFLAGPSMDVFGLIMASLSTEHYQFFFVQSVQSVIGVSAIFISSTKSASTWFAKSLSTAFGIISSSGSIGGANLQW